MKKLYVRVNPKMGIASFFRCGLLFVLAWALVEVDDATAKRLDEEQMLEVSETKPEGFEPADGSNADGDTGGTAGTGQSVPPEDSVKRFEAIAEAIRALDTTDAAAWTNGGVPKTAALEAHTGWPVAAADRDIVWATLKAQ